MEKKAEGEKGRDSRSSETESAARGARLDHGSSFGGNPSTFLRVRVGSNEDSEEDVLAGDCISAQRDQHVGIEQKAPSPPLSTTTITGSSSSKTPSGAGVGGVVPNSSTLSTSGSPRQDPSNLSPHQQLIHIPSSQGSGSPEEYLQNQVSSPDRDPVSATPSHHKLHTSASSHLGSPSRFPVAIKLLVSNNVAGSVIGRQGQTISELQSRSATRIKLSQSGDYFPGTHDRVCLLQGEPENIKTGLRLLLERMFSLHEQECLQHRQHLYASWQLQVQQDQQPAGGVPGIHGVAHKQKQQQQSFDFVVRLLVPTSCCGMIIGKSGSNIKFLEESSGVASVRLSPKENIATVPESLVAPGAVASSASASERVVAITGRTFNSCLQCVFMVFEGMLSHPDVSRYSNMTTSYSRRATQPQMGTGPGQPNSLIDQHLQTDFQQHQGIGIVSPVPITEPFHELPQQPQALMPGSYSGRASLMPINHQTKMENLPRRVLSSPDLQSASFRHSERQHIFRHQSVQLEQLKESGHEHQSALSATALSPHHHSLALQPAPLLSRGVYPFSPSPSFGVGSGFGTSGGSVPHSVSAPDLLAFQFEQGLQVTTPPFQFHQEDAIQKHRAMPPIMTSAPNSPLMLVPPIYMGQNAFQAQIAVPDSVIGSILGRAGKTLGELQLRSGTRIWISQRGEYVPGTRNRVVTIRGQTAESVWQAQLLVGQRIGLPPATATGDLSADSPL